MKKLNLNSTVKVKLNPKGAEIYYHRLDNLVERGVDIRPTLPMVDQYGFTSFQLWIFMSLYGEHIDMCKPEVLDELYLYIDDEDLEDADCLMGYEVVEDEAEYYKFEIRLCDTKIDRDFERFTLPCLRKLSEMFVGKSGFVGQNSIAKIFSTEVLKGKDGEWFIKANASIKNIPENFKIIEEIKSGKKKEVSIGCSVATRTCSICGDSTGSCHHKPGVYYNGKQCVMELDNPTDAYEWAFVVDEHTQTLEKNAR